MKVSLVKGTLLVKQNKGLSTESSEAAHKHRRNGTVGLQCLTDVYGGASSRRVSFQPLEMQTDGGWQAKVEQYVPMGGIMVRVEHRWGCEFTTVQEAIKCKKHCRL